jgi:hypothetical protein
MDSFTALEIALWLGTRKDEKKGQLWSGKTKISNLGSLVSLSVFSRDTLKAIPGEGPTEFQLVKRPKLKQRGAVEIYSPAELKRLLTTAIKTDIDLIPVIVLGGLQGLRPAECHAEGLDRPPFTWEEINWNDRIVDVTGQKVRSKHTRGIPLQPSAARWLQPFRILKGPIWTYVEAHTKKMLALRKLAGVKSVYDGYRRSFASFRIRELDGNLDKLAVEMGNSPEEILGAYKRNVTDAEAAAWFGVMPPAGYAGKIRSVLAQRERFKDQAAL